MDPGTVLQQIEGAEAVCGACVLGVVLSIVAYSGAGRVGSSDGSRLTSNLKSASAAAAFSAAGAGAVFAVSVTLDGSALTLPQLVALLSLTVDTSLRLSRRSVSLYRSIIAPLVTLTACVFALVYLGDSTEVWTIFVAILAASSLAEIFFKSIYTYNAIQRSLHEEGPLGETLDTPEVSASIFSLLIFGWFTSLIVKGSKRPLNQEDLWKLRDCDETETVLSRFHKIHKSESSNKPSRHLLISLLLVSWKPFSIQMFCSAVMSVLGFGNPFFLFKILSWIQQPTEDRNAQEGWYLIFGLFFCNVINGVVSGQLYFHGRRVGRTMRAVLVSEIFGKSMRRVAGVAAPKVVAANETNGEDSAVANAPAAPTDEDGEEATLGKIATLMSVDTERFTDFMCYVQDPFINFPISVSLAFVGLYKVIGLSAIAGLTVIVLSGPLSTLLGAWVNKVQQQYMKSVDKRVAITNETLNGIRIIKYFSWEDQFGAKILAARAVELKNLLKLNFIYIAMSILNFSMATLCFFITFTVYTLVEGKTLDAATAFSSVLLLERLTELLGWAPQLVMWVMKSKVALDRIIAFLKETELERFSNPNEDDAAEYIDTPVLGFKNGQFRYFTQEDAAKVKKDAAAASRRRTASDGGAIYESIPNSTAEESGDLVSGPDFSLKDVTIDFLIGGLNVVTGPTGGGKSSLILALLGEMKTVQGRSFIPRTTGTDLSESSVAYVSQTAWLLNATIRENILMGAKYDEQRYRATLECCSLLRDLAAFPGGDLTEIGEKGVSISGGQKQRISLARAVYSDASVVLLDDPLSAVDAPTARHLLKYAILKELKGRTVILVTHAVSLTGPFADWIVVLRGGSVVAQGTPEDVARNEGVEELNNQMLAQSINLTDDDVVVEDDSQRKDVVAQDEDGTKLVDEEKRATGSVSLKVYKTYWDACGGLLFLLSFIVFQILQTGVNVGNDWWLAKWTSSTNSTLDGNGTDFLFYRYESSYSSPIISPFVMGASVSEFSTTNPLNFKDVLSATSLRVQGGISHSDTMFYIGIYGLFGFSKVLVSIVLNLINVFGAIRASQSLHHSLLKSVLGAPLRFFETTPLGRILNRFSKDISTVDEDVMNTIMFFFHQLVKGITIIAVISTTAPWFLVSFVPIFWAYMSITRLYLNVSRELKRLQSVSRSPIFSLFSECLAGVVTLRAYGQTKRFSHMSSERVNANHKAFYLLWTANRWLCIRTDLISATVILCAGAAVVSGNVGAGWAALTLTYAGQFSEALLWVVRMHADMEMSLNSVERCREYMDIEQEPARIVEDYRPSAEWPQKGEIVVDSLCVRYGGDDQPYVLNGITFSTRPGEKIGVVGRTGAGKSTLSLAFFRIIPLAEGTITIDGMDIGRMGLSDLRSKLTIIPQDPVLFTGTIRSNLDPHGECDDAELWHVLRATHVLESYAPAATPTVTTVASAAEPASQYSSVSSTATLVQPDDTINESPLLKHVKSFTSSTTAAMTSAGTSNSITLDSPVTENGNNFSQGQRQLLCMARALLRRSRVVFLDEATASIDAATDSKIQQTIRDELKDATVLTIAHRLKTVVDYDRVLVLDAGRVVEFGTPIELIEANSHFRKMCDDSGEIGELIEAAKKAEIEKKLNRN
ncbi:hypothetical protein HK100_007633 [Physocladia obscura]|uniref:ABC transporter n=1 Tax=Physocladia obscura TaxID=109957 RepID=A0AAD5T567_9FUNG|nr:hypothetical protein HK100_007633 [Physocladia obscura]